MKGAIALFLMIAAPASAQETRSAVPGARPAPASVNDFAWLKGEWIGEGLDQQLYENYSAPVGGQISAHFYAAKDGKPSFYEFEMISQTGDTVEYRVRHFNPDMSAWEDKAKFMRFPLVAAERNAWYFDGLTIRRTGPDRMDHIVRLRSKEGIEKEATFHYHRIRS